jgi:hypothetical protein
LSELARLHQRLLVGLCLTALIAFISGAGLEAPLVLVSALAWARWRWSCAPSW